MASWMREASRWRRRLPGSREAQGSARQCARAVRGGARSRASSTPPDRMCPRSAGRRAGCAIDPAGCRGKRPRSTGRAPRRRRVASVFGGRAAACQLKLWASATPKLVESAREVRGGLRYTIATHTRQRKAPAQCGVGRLRHRSGWLPWKAPAQHGAGAAAASSGERVRRPGRRLSVEIVGQRHAEARGKRPRSAGWAAIHDCDAYTAA